MCNHFVVPNLRFFFVRLSLCFDSAIIRITIIDSKLKFSILMFWVKHFGRRKRDLFASIIDWIKQKVKSWSTKFLSTAGKLVMLQSVLSPISSYSKTCFKLPNSLCQRIQSVVTRFWWDNNESTRKMAWVAWDKIATPKAVGGLGMRDFMKLNDSLLAKIVWRLLCNPDSLLGKMLKGKYFADNNFLLALETTVISHGWRGILVGCDLLLENIGWAVGDGFSINLWQDPWLSLDAQERPMGPSPESASALLVSDLMVPGERRWDRSKIQLLIPDYEEQVLCLKPSLSGASDKICWLGSKSGEYSAKSGYYIVVQEDNGEETLPLYFNWRRNVWNLDIAPKVKLSSWKLLNGPYRLGKDWSSDI